MSMSANPFGMAEGVPLLGEVICWACPGVSVSHADLLTALAAAGLDEGVARELAPRHAFRRACRKLARERIIRQAAEDSATVTFQFTSEHRSGGRFEYELETLLTLTKATGQVTCPLADLAALAQAEVDRCMAARTGNDVTRVVQKLFERKADLFPVRPQGGAYFVPARFAPFVDRVQSFLGGLGGQLLRFPVPAGTSHGDRAVKCAVAEGIRTLIAEQDAAVAAFGEDTRPSTLERAAERVKVVRFKVESYAALLAEQKSLLEDELAAASNRLREKVESLTVAHAV